MLLVNSIPGQRGDVGLPGLSGPDGQKGGRGEVGVAGLPGFPGSNGVKGQLGDEGLPGLIGLNGAPGYPGDMGQPGIRGPRGRNGIGGQKGLPGERGRPGPMGIPGREGFNGMKGENGRNGRPGLQGLPGPKGISGIPGRVGPRGPPGLQGKKGQDGVDAAPGPAPRPRGFFFTTHSQTTNVPRCPSGTIPLWDGYSLLHIYGNAHAQGQDLGIKLQFFGIHHNKLCFPAAGQPGSCLRKFSTMPYLFCNLNNVCDYASRNDYSYWLSTQAPMPMSMTPIRGPEIEKFVSKSDMPHLTNLDND